MPKFKSIPVTSEVVDGTTGKKVRSVDVIYVPQDEAAFLEPICDKALNAKLILKSDGTPYTPEEFAVKREEIRVMFQKREEEANKRRPQY